MENRLRAQEDERKEEDVKKEVYSELAIKS
jgi:hypothetical protein